MDEARIFRSASTISRCTVGTNGSAWDVRRSFFARCCGHEFFDSPGARAYIRHMREHLGSGVLFRTVVTTGATDWLALYCGRAFEHLEAMGEATAQSQTGAETAPL